MSGGFQDISGVFYSKDIWKQKSLDEVRKRSNGPNQKEDIHPIWVSKLVRANRIAI
jgi:hypothetical protein